MPLCLYLNTRETVSTVEHLGVRHKPQPFNHKEQKKNKKTKTKRATTPDTHTQFK